MGSHGRDEKAIRALVTRWHRAMGAGDLAALLSMISEDAVFLAAERPPMRGRAAFAQELAALMESCTIQSSAEIEEVLVSDDLACCWATLTVTTTPLDGSAPTVRARAGAVDLSQGARRTLGARARRQHARVRRRRAGAQGRQPRARADGRRPRRLSAPRGDLPRSPGSSSGGAGRGQALRSCPRRARPCLDLAETALLTLLALVAFASNSILTRMALGSGLMDAATFTTARLAAGALVLAAARAAARARVQLVTAARARAGRGAGAGDLRGAVLVRLRAHRRGDRRAAAVRRGSDHDDRLGDRLGRAAAPAHLGRPRAGRRRSRVADVTVGGRPARSDRQRADGGRRLRLGRVLARGQGRAGRARGQRAQLHLGAARGDVPERDRLVGRARQRARPAARGDRGRHHLRARLRHLVPRAARADRDARRRCCS